MTTVTVDDVQRDLTGYLGRVQAGEAFVIAKNHEPIAELRPVEPLTREPRPFGLCAGEFRVPDDFDDPLPEEVLREFEGS